MTRKPGDTRTCDHEYIVPSSCAECRRYIEARRAARKAAKRRRIPPLHNCEYGHTRRSYSEACPECAKALHERTPAETLREFRERLNRE